MDIFRGQLHEDTKVLGKVLLWHLASIHTIISNNWMCWLNPSMQQFGYNNDMLLGRLDCPQCTLYVHIGSPENFIGNYCVMTKRTSRKVKGHWCNFHQTYGYETLVQVALVTLLHLCFTSGTLSVYGLALSHFHRLYFSAEESLLSPHLQPEDKHGSTLRWTLPLNVRTFYLL